MGNPEKLSTLQEVALRFRVCDKTVRRWMLKGQIAAIGAGRQLRFEEKEIKRFMAARKRSVPK